MDVDDKTPKRTIIHEGKFFNKGFLTQSLLRHKGVSLSLRCELCAQIMRTLRIFSLIASSLMKYDLGHGGLC